MKRIRAVKIEPSETGLTIIGGNNNQGKTSVLDSIRWALGGDKFLPASGATRTGSTAPPKINIALNNGLIVERSGINGSLKVIDSNGYQKSGQALLNSFISTFALDLPKFMNATSKEKLIHFADNRCEEKQAATLENEEKPYIIAAMKSDVLQIRSAKFAAEMPEYDDVPKSLFRLRILLCSSRRYLPVTVKISENVRIVTSITVSLHRHR